LKNKTGQVHYKITLCRDPFGHFFVLNKYELPHYARLHKTKFVGMPAGFKKIVALFQSQWFEKRTDFCQVVFVDTKVGLYVFFKFCHSLVCRFKMGYKGCIAAAQLLIAIGLTLLPMQSYK
jgi:hypothetical protein